MLIIVNAYMGGRKVQTKFFERSKAEAYAKDLPKYGYTRISIQTKEAPQITTKKVQIIKG